MEAKGAAELFLRSIEKRNLMYTTFVGDGNYNWFGTVKEEYEKLGIGYDIVKEECVGHIQKQLGTALRQLKRRMRGTKLADGKKVGEVNVWKTKSLIKCKIISEKQYVRTVET